MVLKLLRRPAATAVSFFLANVPQADSYVIHSYPGGFFQILLPIPYKFSLLADALDGPFLMTGGLLPDLSSQIHRSSSKTQATYRDCSFFCDLTETRILSTEHQLMFFFNGMGKLINS